MISLHNKNPAFTIVELLVVIVVIGILAAITIVSYTGISGKASVASVQADLSNAATTLKLYYADYGVYPVSMPINGDDKYCPTDTKYCIKPSTNITYEYTPNSTINPTSFCLTTIANSISYKVTDTSSPAQGDRTTYGLVLSLDAGNSASYPGSGTTWTDLSGLGNNGTLMNGPTYSSANGGIIVFDGADDYVNAGNANILNPGSMDYTISIWMKTTDNNGAIITKDIGSGSGFRFDLLAGWDGNCLFWFLDSTRHGSAYVYAGYTATNGNWHQIVGTLNRDSKKMTSYSDGSLWNLNTLTGFAEGTITNNAPLLIGSSFTGSISNIRIYNRALSSSEITQNFNATKSRYGL